MVFACATPLTRTFFGDPSSEVYILTISLFRIYALAVPLSAFFSNFFQGPSRMRMVHSLATSTVYSSVLGLNILTMTF